MFLRTIQRSVFLPKWWWMLLDEYCPSIELHRTVAVVTKTSTVHHVEQVVLHRAPAASSKHWRPDCSSLRRPDRALCSPHFSLPSIMFCPFLLLFSPLTLTHRVLPREMRGVTVNHRWGYEKSVCVHASAHTRVFHGWFRRVGCETWEVGRGGERKEQQQQRQQQQQCDRDSTGQRPSPLSPFLLLLSPLGEIQQLHQIQSTSP